MTEYPPDPVPSEPIRDFVRRRFDVADEDVDAVAEQIAETLEDYIEPPSEKYLRFADEYVDAVRSGEKWITARYCLERHFEPGDVVDAVTEGGSVFAALEIVAVASMTTGRFTRLADVSSGHGSYADVDELLDRLDDYYGNGPPEGWHEKTLLRVFWFDVVDRKCGSIQLSNGSRIFYSPLDERTRDHVFDAVRGPDFPAFGDFLRDRKSAEQIVDEIDAILEDPFDALGVERPKPGEWYDKLVDAAAGAAEDGRLMDLADASRYAAGNDRVDWIVDDDFASPPDDWIGRGVEFTIDEDDVGDDVLERIRSGRVEDFSISFEPGLEIEPMPSLEDMLGDARAARYEAHTDRRKRVTCPRCDADGVDPDGDASKNCGRKPYCPRCSGDGFVFEDTLDEDDDHDSAGDVIRGP